MTDTVRPTRYMSSHLEVLAVARRLWRVRDLRVPAADAACLLGFVERRADLYEVVRMADPWHPSWCDSLDAAIRLLDPDATPEST